jgi:AcrR family transcriptional regulator
VTQRSIAHPDETTSAAAGGRERILLAAFRMFAERGFSGVSMQQIAVASGITKATLYHHFHDKEDLFVEVMRDQFARSQERLSRSVAAGETFRGKLLAFGEVLFSAERADLSRLLGDFHYHVAPERQAAFWSTYERPWTYLEDTVAAAMATGEIALGDPVLVARVCFSAFVGQMQISRFEADIPSPSPALAVEVVDMLLAGLQPRG